MDLSADEKKKLLHIARESIRSAVEGRAPQEILKASLGFEDLRGAFVTLRIEQELRGCVGYVEPRFPLGQTIQEVAVKAAFEDPRFFPLSPPEVNRIEIEISVLSSLERVDNVSEIVVGVHGLVVDAGYRRGLLLPQVATEYQWDRIQFLNHTAIKAGLPPDAWQTPEVSVFKFTVDRFSESELLLEA